MSVNDSQKKFAIKLNSRKILGPLDIQQVRLLILNDEINGSEKARYYPDGEWKDVQVIPEIGELLIAKFSGKLDATEDDPQGATLKLVSSDEDPDATIKLPPEHEKTRGAKTQQTLKKLTQSIQVSKAEPKTMTGKTTYSPNLSGESTLVFEGRKKEKTKTELLPPKSSSKSKSSSPLVRIALLLLILYLISDWMKRPPGPDSLKVGKIEIKVPVQAESSANPEKSAAEFKKGLEWFEKDHLEGYQRAAGHFSKSATYDISNAPALAYLTMSYLRWLGEVPTSGDLYSTLARLIETIQTHGKGLSSTALAQVEYYLTLHQTQAAEASLMDYVKANKPDAEHYLAMARIQYLQGDFRTAAEKIGKITDDQIKGPKVYYLRGQIAEALLATTEALEQYTLAIKGFPDHTKSRLKIAILQNQLGTISKSKSHLEKIIEQRSRISNRDSAMAYWLYSKVLLLEKKPDLAIEHIEKAIELDPGNHDFYIEYFALQAAQKEGGPGVKERAKLYYHLSEGERLIKIGQYQKAVNSLMQAQVLDSGNYRTSLKLGESFLKMGDFKNGIANYKKALEKKPNDLSIGSAYISALIDGYHWETAVREVENLPATPQGRYLKNKLKGDLSLRAGAFVEAIGYYKNAAQLETIDPGLYFGFAEALYGIGQFKEALFYYQMAYGFLRERVAILRGIALSIAGSDSYEKAIQWVKREAPALGDSRAEPIILIAELELQKGDLAQAERNLSLARTLDPNYPEIYLQTGKMFLAKEGADDKAREKALDAFGTYLKLKPMDPKIRIERFHVYRAMKKWDRAWNELKGVLDLYPKYPGLHFYLGEVADFGNDVKTAIKEYQVELQNHPHDVRTMIALGGLLTRQREFSQALEILSTAMRLAPQSSAAVFEAARANFQLNNYEGAIVLFQRAAALDPGNPEIYKNLGIAYKSMGKTAEAEAAFRKQKELSPDG